MGNFKKVKAYLSTAIPQKLCNYYPVEIAM